MAATKSERQYTYVVTGGGGYPGETLFTLSREKTVIMIFQICEEPTN